MLSLPNTEHRKPNTLFPLAAALLLLTVFPARSSSAVETLDIAPVWSGHPVGFCLLTHGKHQFVAYYDADRQMTVASRAVDQQKWDFVKLPTSVGWDSHNYITMTTDDQGCIHLAGNMHAVPLVYFRTSRPDDTHSFEKLPMVGHEEDRCTYPIFMRGGKNELIFMYRHGHSGEGDQYFNRYDEASRTWRRLMDQPLTKGSTGGAAGHMNAYFSGFFHGPDGLFHTSWVWRNTGDCATNHDLCYARSGDMAHWETSDGKPLKLPITIATAEVVDPTPPGGGMINGGNHLGFDSRGRILIAYFKYDAAGKTQAYIARREPAGWKSYQISQWDYRWEFRGGGSIEFEINVDAPKASSGGTIVVGYRHSKYGRGAFRLDEQTLKPVTSPNAAGTASSRVIPVEAISLTATEKPVDKPESTFPGMMVHRVADIGRSDEPGVRYEIRWETLGRNRDRPREGPLPPPSMLRLYLWK